MRVKHLLVSLQNADPEAEVLLGYDYGDRSNSTVTKYLREVETEPLLVDSAYGPMLTRTAEPDEFEEDEGTDREDTARERGARFVVLS